MPRTEPFVDPYLNCNFLVEIDGLITAGFQECSGLESSIEVIDYREGGAMTPRKIPGQTKYANIVLKKGLTDDVTLYDWHQRAVDGEIERKNGSIIVLHRSVEVLRWNFHSAWPAKWTGPSFSASANQVAIVSLELAHERIERA